MLYTKFILVQLEIYKVPNYKSKTNVYFLPCGVRKVSNLGNFRSRSEPIHLPEKDLLWKGLGNGSIMVMRINLGRFTWD